MPNMPKTLQTLIIEHVEPELDGGRYPVKRIVGETMEVSADIFKEGHDIIGAVLRHKKHGQNTWSESPMHHVDNRSMGREVLIVRKHKVCLYHWCVYQKF